MADVGGWSKTWTFFDGDWREGNAPIMGPRTHAAWLGSSVFDGARAFEGVAPDLDLHFARVNQSAAKMYLKPSVSTETWLALARDGLRLFDKQSELYIRPMYWAEKNGWLAVAPDPEFDALVSDALRSANAKTQWFLNHSLAVSSSDDGDHAGRRQGGLPLSE